MADMSRCRRQKLGLHLVLLLLGQELQAAKAASIGADVASYRYRSFGIKDNDSEKVSAAFPLSSVTESDIGGRIRMLLNTFAGWSWPAQTSLSLTTFSVAGDELTSPATVQEVLLMAGLVYDSVKIEAAGVTFGTAHDNARIKLVTEIADRTTCHLTDYALYDVPMGTIVLKPDAAPWTRSGASLMGTQYGALTLARVVIATGDELFVDTSTALRDKGSLAFMFGGVYQLCYTPDGSFGGGDDTEYKNNVLNTKLKILGVRSDCQTDQCIESARWECYFTYKAERPSQCVFNLKLDGGRPGWGIQTGGMSKFTWSAKYDSGSMTEMPICGDTEPDTTVLDTTSTGTFLKLDGIADPVDMPQVQASYTGSSFTLGACYCPNYNVDTGASCTTDTSLCCRYKQDYVQNFGIIYYWRVRICDVLNFATCSTPYMRVIPQQKFVLRVDCPPNGGCIASNDNRIKYLSPQASNERPTWDAQHGCKTTILESGRALWPSPLDSRTLGGGGLTSYKAWNDKEVKLQLSLQREMDVCYCNEACETPNNWFKIGAVESADAFGFASKIDAGSSINTIKYVNDSGSVTFFGGIVSGTVRNPYDSNKYSGKALLNIISYDRDLRYGIGDLKKTLEDFNNYNLATPTSFQAQMDSECQREDYNPTLVQGAWTKLDTKNYIAKVTSTASQYLSFSGEQQQQQLTIARSGVVAICYCAVLSDQDACLDPSNWIYSGRLTIRGPVGGQEWIFPTNIVVRVGLEGWGFTSADKLRIISETASCSDNTNSPDSDTSFKVGCPQTYPANPSSALGCRYATTTQSIDLEVYTSESNTAYISGVATTETYSTLSFSKSMQNILYNEDVITINSDRIKNNGNLVGAQNDQEKFMTYRLSGNIPFQDDNSKDYLVGHRVNFVETAGVINYQQMRIPAGFPTSGGSSSFTFTDGQGYWIRHNKVQTPVEIKGEQEKDKLKVCWGATDGGNTEYHAQAGVLTFENPPKMTVATINLSTRQRDAVAPVIIAFTTKAASYAAAKAAEQTLMLRFLDVGTNGNFVPRYADDSAPDSAGPEYIPPDTEVTVANKQQYVCGRLFIELWSGDTEGFPMPVGCYYSKKLRDISVLSGTPKYFRELYLTFPVGSGLRQQTNYQIVINAAIKEISLGDELLNIYSMCTSETGCLRPYQVFEYGDAKATNGTLVKATMSDPQFNTQGFVIQRGDAVDQVLDLSSMNILQVKLRGREENAAIQKKCILRVYMWPLTLWSLGEGSCQAECVPYHANNARCDGPISCTTESVIGGGSKNIIKLVLPADMDDITGTTQHTVKVTGLTLPQAGYFASRVGAQITRPAPADDRASYTTSVGMLMKKADVGQTTGRLVLSDRTGYGPLPFASDVNNILYLRLSFGATVWNNGQQDAAFVTITLPDGYTCKVPDNGAPDYTLAIFTNDLDNDGYYDNNRGSLSVDGSDGTWANSQGKVCTYAPAQYNRIYQGMVAYVKVTVDNPSAAMSKLYFKNVWKIKLSSKGANTINPNAADMNEQDFISLAEAKLLGSDYWASNAAVISALQQETIQPTDFRRTTSTYTDSLFLHVFFYTTQYVGRNGYVLLDAPDGFDFGASCLAQDLPEEYYAYRGPPSASNSALLQRFKNVATCTGLRVPHTASTYNRARIVVGGIIDVEKFYGYQVRVTHPSTYLTSQQTTWYLWTQDSNRYVLEGSQTTVKFNKLQSSSQTDFYHKAYGMYDQAFFSTFHINIANLQPRSVTDQFTEVMIYPFVFSQYTDTSLRITAPYGYQWQADINHFSTEIANTTKPFPAFPDFQSGDNQMVWQRLEFEANEAYGFQAKISIPDFSPATSSNAFFVEFGFNKDAIAQRLMAGMIYPQQIQTFTNCLVSYGSNLMSYTNNPFEFNFQMVTSLPENDGIVIKGDSNTLGFAFTCPPTLLEGSASFPSDMECSSFKAVDESPLVVLKAGLTPISPGQYMFEMNANNPTRKILTAGNWDMGSYKSVSDYPNSAAIDKAMQATGFTINGPILSAGLVQISDRQRTLTNRNDRPNKANQLIFKFSLRKEPESDLPLKLRAPRGFEFDEDCSGAIITDQNYVFGPNTEGLWPPEYSVWQTQYSPTSCTGNGRFAEVMVPIGLEKRVEYVFRIGIVSNPPGTPLWNWWTIDYNSESSDPFPSFTVWTFTQTLVTPVSFAKSPTGANVAKTVNPVEINFRPYKRIPFKCPSCATGGMIRVTSPSRFEFVQTSGECNAMLFETATGSQNAFPTANLRCSVSPTLVTKLWLEIIAGEVAVESGRDYTLIVYVYNPSVTDQAQDWYLDSFDTRASANVNQDEIALDESVIPGHAIHNVLNTWTVVNQYQSQNGKAYVSDVDVTMQFPDALKDNDLIQIYSPFEFDIAGDADLGNCKDFRWPANTNPLPGTRMPGCACASGQCVMTFTITEFKDPAYPQNQNIQFKIATENPAKTPFVTQDFWRVEHKRNSVIKSSHVYPSWSINPQLENVQIELVGTNQAAGTESDLSFSFLPVSDANTIKIEALFPTEFDFGRATVPVPYDIDDRRDRGTIIINRAGVIAGRVTTLQISSVQLGRGGGQTRFNLVTYRDETLAEKMDEKLEYTGGFRLPGAVSVSSQDLQSKYKAERQLFPVRSLFQARVNELAKAEFVLMFSQPATASQKLVISCLGAGAYELKTSPFVIIGKERVDTSVALTPGSTTELQATLKPGRPATEVALQADTPYTVIFNVIPVQGTNNWKFQTTDGGTYPTNTNDGITPGFRPVEQMVLTVATPRSPPRAEIDVVLNVDQGSAIVLELLVIAPPYFVFPSTGCGDLCQAGQALGATMRRTATIASTTGEPLTALTGLQIKVVTPEQTPGGAEFWFVEARGQGRGTTTGWAAGAGFRVVQMVSGVSYAGVSSLRGAQISFHFTIDLDAGTEIAIEGPTNYILSCSTAGALQVGSLPGPGMPGCTDEPLVLMLGSSLRRDVAYSFAVAVDLPAETPSPNTFNMIIRDQDNTVVDAVYGLAGVNVQPVPVTSPTLSWSRAEPAQKSTITIGITFTSDYSQVKALLITLPNTFLHEVLTPTQVTNLNRRFPVAASQAGGWAKTNDQDRIRIELDDSDDSTVIAAGTYAWSFPVLVPANFAADIPRINVWYFSLCSARSCREPNDRDVIVSFPIQGFQLGEVSPTSVKGPTDSARMSRLSLGAFAPVLAMGLHGA